MVAEINRPKALNALNLEVVTCMNEKLAEWNKIESGVSCFILKGTVRRHFVLEEMSRQYGKLKILWTREVILLKQHRMNHALYISRYPGFSLDGWLWEEVLHIDVR